MEKNIQNQYTKELEEYIYILFNTPEGKPGRNYLKLRGITKETAMYWKIGYCPIGYTSSINRQFNIKSKFQGRIIFPVFDQNGVIVTITGRKIFDTLPGPKYDMYPFPARKILFGLWQNKANIREQGRAIVTEGQLDVITAWQKGLKIVTSTFGAHGTLWHLGLLARYAKRLDILYDNDSAGFEGVEGIKKLSTLGDLDIRFQNNIFPKGEDLDSWIKNHSLEELFILLDQGKILSLKEKLKRLESRIK